MTRAVRGLAPEDRETLSRLLVHSPDAAAAELASLSETSRDPSLWNDFGAALYAADRFSEALGAIDQALILDPELPEAHFNRALVLEKFHLREPAAEAWREFLRRETDEGWSDEARRHLAALEPQERTFANEVERGYPRLQRGDRSAARDLLGLDAGEARSFGEVEGLARWGAAWLRGDQVDAANHLSAMRTLATELAANRESLLADSVAAIDRAAEQQRAALARGHVAYRDGRAAFDARLLGEAERLLDAAIRDFTAGESPAAIQAGVFAAAARYWQGRQDEAERELQKLASHSEERHQALRATLEWQFGVVAIGRAETGTALVHLGRAIETFTALGERDNAAYLHNITAQVYDGARDEQRAAWHRELALRELGKRSNARLGHALNGMVYEALQRKAWRVARSFVNLQIAIGKEVQDGEIRTAALLRSARFHRKLGDRTSAEATLREAEGVAASVRDPEHREKLMHDCAAARALMSDDPHTAIPLLTEALRFHDEKGSRRLMPELHLHRGRLHRALGDTAQAARDFESGIVLVEKNRDTLAKGERRWGILDAASELFDEATVEALRSAGAEAAFAYAERKRARSLADVVDAPFQRAKLPAGTLIVEYASLPDRLLVFTITRDGCTVREVAVTGDALQQLAARFVSALRQNDADRSKAAGALHANLIAPAWREIAAHEHVVFVTDAATSGIPFAALPGGAGRMLVEDVTISVAPSARAFLAARTRARSARANVLIVDGPINDALEHLPATSIEAQRVERSYPRARRLSGAKATREAFLEESRQAEVIHFAGHGLASVDSAALVLTSGPADEGILDAASISRLSLNETDVVVLAACDTSRGPVRAAEGVLSVTHAFLQAGAATVVATMWPLADRDAAAFFPRLHRHLAAGMPAAEALRLAQIESIRSSPDNAATWAAVEVVGY